MSVNLIFRDGVDDVPFLKLGEEIDPNINKFVMVFPEIDLMWPDIMYDGQYVIRPYMYYVTSGEAIRKTEVLISDVKVLLNKPYPEDILYQLSEYLIEMNDFLDLLIETRGMSVYLEITKCEDGIYDGNIISRKDPKKKKEK